MGKTYDQIDDGLSAFIAAQHMFFVATAPTHGGRVNLSPKGLDTLRILDDRRVAYLDLTGSGIETIAHLRDNGRITLMFCAFEGRPNIVRVYGTGRAVLPGAAGFDELVAQFPANPGVRSVIVVDVESASDSCGFAVPTYEYVGDRDVLTKWTERNSDTLDEYRLAKNSSSIDGLPGLPR